MTTALEGGEGSASRPSRPLPLGKTRYPLYRRLVGPQGRSGQVQKISPAPGFDLRTVQPVASRYTDYATWLTFKCILDTNFYECRVCVCVCVCMYQINCAVSMAQLTRTTLLNGRPSPSGAKYFYLLENVQNHLGPNQHLTQYVPGVLSLGGRKQLGHEVDSSPAPTASVWSYTSTPCTCLRGRHRENVSCLLSNPAVFSTIVIQVYFLLMSKDQEMYEQIT